MSWLPQSRFDEARAAAVALTPKQREALTWEEAQQFVVHDTLEMAKWGGLKKSGLKPWAAVAVLKGIAVTRLGTFCMGDPCPSCGEGMPCHCDHCLDCGRNIGYGTDFMEHRKVCGGLTPKQRAAAGPPYFAKWGDELEPDEMGLSRYDDRYHVLLGPNGFECALTEPEDRSWSRDGAKVVAELNRLHMRVAALEAKSTEFLRHACRPGDDGKYDDAFDDARVALRNVLHQRTKPRGQVFRLELP